MLIQPPLALYIHFPWCIQKCPYCDFNSFHAPRQIPEEKYIDALIADLQQEQVRLKNHRPIQSIFLGGGTPSLFSGQAMHRLFDAIKSLHPLASNCEITLEANPGAIDYKNFAEYFDCGINRLSLGVQSFCENQLKKLGRIHSSKDPEQAIYHARTAGFNNINIDLMYALSQQTIEQAQADLKQALALEPTHLSWYQLTIEPNTEFYRHPPPQPSDDQIIEIENMGHNLLQTHGFHRYEISAYALAKQQAAHNLNYWQFGDYLGIGAGAHSKITQVEQQEVRRFWKYRTPNKYLDHSRGFTAQEKVLAHDDLIFEFMLNGLRLMNGFSWQDFTQKTGLSSQQIQAIIDSNVDKGLLESNQLRCKPTPLGSQFLNDLVMSFG